MPRALLIILATFPLPAQFSGLATTNDGTQLYFSSSLQLSGTTDENPYSKIFLYNASGFHLAAQVHRIVTGAKIC
ncbi:MAG: hypothetical protein ABSF22_04685 [Bryobacteraceae bacterium]